MSNATKIIKANDLEALSEKIKDLDIVRLMRITKKSINLSRRDCFYLIIEHSKKFLNNENYHKEYIQHVLKQATDCNSLYAIEYIFKQPYFDLNQINFKPILESYYLKTRVAEFYIKNIPNLKSQNIDNYSIILKNIENHEGFLSKNIKLVKVIKDYFGFDFYEFERNLHKNKNKYDKYMIQAGLTFSVRNLLSFSQTFLLFEETEILSKYFTEEDKEKFELYRIQNKIEQF